MTGRQLRALVALRWRMVRSAQARRGFLALAAAVPFLCLAALAVGIAAPDQRSLDVLLLAPTAYLAVALVAVLAPLVAGGGNELFPEDQVVAFPVTARTRFAASLALSPLNLAWSTQLVGLVGITAYVAPDTALVGLSVVTCLTYVALVTVAGHALAWVVVGVRQSRPGRTGTWAAAVLSALVAALVVVTGNVATVLDRLPTTYVVIGAVNGAAGAWGWWLLTTAVLVALTVAALAAGRRACAWALRRPGDAAERLDAHVVRRRRPRAGFRAEVLAIDRASVWRSASLRRGLLVLAVLPGLVAAAAGLDWPSLVLLPGLVAAGAGLLFGVNAFCLDGPGSVWLASLPRHARTAFWCKAQVVGEVCVLAMTLTLAAGSLRAGRLPSSGEAAAVAACSVVVLLRVVATCMTLSVTRPHRADLRGPRDTPAPPGVMAAYSARLAVSTTLLAVVFSGLAEFAAWHWSVLVAVPIALLSVRRLVSAGELWRQPVVRSRVVSAVTSG